MHRYDDLGFLMVAAVVAIAIAVVETTDLRPSNYRKKREESSRLDMMRLPGVLTYDIAKMSQISVGERRDGDAAQMTGCDGIRSGRSQRRW